MHYILQNEMIIFKDETGHIKCSGFDTANNLRSQSTSFVQKNLYQTTVSSIFDTLKNTKNGKEPDTLIINSPLYRYSGFINALIDRLGNDTIIKSDLEIAISSQNLKPGEYSLLDISKNESYHYNVSIDSNDYSLQNKTKL